MDKIETPEFVMIQDGQLMDKAQQLAGIRKRSGKALDQSHSVEVHKFVLNGNVAVLTGYNVVKAPTASDRVTFTEVWVRDGSQWQVAQGHYSSTK